MAGIKKWFDGVLCIGALITAGLATVASAGPVGGSTCWVDRVEAYSSDVFHLTFYGGEVATVTVVGDGDTDLDLYVYDEFGNPIASDTSLSDNCYVQFCPYWTGTFRIEVRNLGSVYNEYVICVE